VDEYFKVPMLADPLCRLNVRLETGGAAAAVSTTSDQDLRPAP
jgi:hypothetical protein